MKDNVIMVVDVIDKIQFCQKNINVLSQTDREQAFILDVIDKIQDKELQTQYLARLRDIILKLKNLFKIKIK